MSGPVNVVDYVLDGLERWLEVERECGVRSLEVDRALLAPTVGEGTKKTEGTNAANGAGVASRAGPASRQAPTAPAGQASPTGAVLDFVFLHDKPLTPAGVKMMAKIVNAMGRTADTAPVIVAPPLPQARAYIVLGALALRKYFPGVKGEPGQWVKSPDGTDALITYSPAFILRFPTVTEAVDKMKHDMWNSLKGVMQRFNGGRDGK